VLGSASIQKWNGSYVLTVVLIHTGLEHIWDPS